jgi:outer membrane protein insertion porin family
LPQRLIRPALAVVLAAAALLLAAAAVPVGAQTDELPEELRSIAGVSFRGQHRLGRRKLAAAGLRTRKPSVLPWRERPMLRRDYLRSDSSAIVSLYRHYGYLDASVRVNLLPGRDPRSAKVEFVIHEGPLTRVSRVDMTGVRSYPEAELRRSLLAQPGSAYDPVFLQLDALKIRTLYQERGFRVGVDTLSRRGVPDSVHVAVSYGVVEGRQYRVGRIEYFGNPQIRDNLGRREVLLRPGDIFRSSRLDLSREHMYSTGLFRQVQVTQQPDTLTGTMDLLVRIQPRPPRWVDVGIGTGTSNRYQLTGQWGHRNLDSRALGGVLVGQLARDGQNHPRTEAATFTLSEPWLFGVRLLGQVSTFYRRDHDRSNAKFVQHIEQHGFNFSLYRELSRISRVTLVQENTFATQTYEVLRDSANSVQDSLARAVVPRYVTNALRLTLERDLRDDRITPHRGSYQSLSMEVAGGPLKGTSSYRKGLLTSTWYTPHANGSQLAVRTSVGMMQPVGSLPESFSPEIGLDASVGRVPRESRFSIGGVNSLRGYSENSIPPSGGLAMLLFNIEWRVPLAGPFGVEIFGDAGNVWARPEYIRARNFVAPWRATTESPSDIRYSYGIGGRLVLPFGPLRVDLAWSDRPDFPRGGHFPWGGHVPFVYQFAIGPSF